ncbi:MAG: DUF2752 domain-containing protein [Bacteroidales bacterium]
MTKSKTSLYLILVCVLGYLWIAISINYTLDDRTVCLVKNIYGIPCPTCGSTHGVIALLSGDLYAALKYNPNSYLLALIMLFIPACAVSYLIFGKEWMYGTYKKVNCIIKKPLFLIIFLTAEAAVWGYKLGCHFGWI